MGHFEIYFIDRFPVVFQTRDTLHRLVVYDIIGLAMQTTKKHRVIHGTRKLELLIHNEH